MVPIDVIKIVPVVRRLDIAADRESSEDTENCSNITCRHLLANGFIGKNYWREV